MQLAYKENCMRNCRQRKDIRRHAVYVGLIQAMNINLPDFPTVCVLHSFQIEKQIKRKNYFAILPFYLSAMSPHISLAQTQSCTVMLWTRNDENLF